MEASRLRQRLKKWWALKPSPLTRSEAAEVIENFLEGRGGPYDWDDFCTFPIVEIRNWMPFALDAWGFRKNSRLSTKVGTAVKLASRSYVSTCTT